MIKAIIYLAVALSALGIYMGVIQVNFHLEKLGNISSITHGIGNWQDAVAQGQYYGTVWKRTAELYFASSADAKFNLDVGYVSSDSENLKKALDAGSGVNIIVIKSKLLSDTLNRAKDEMKNVSKDGIAKVRDDALKAFASAQVQLDRLQAVANQYKDAQSKLEQIAKPTKIPLKF
jgi:hypothetical protein